MTYDPTAEARELAAELGLEGDAYLKLEGALLDALHAGAAEASPVTVVEGEGPPDIVFHDGYAEVRPKSMLEQAVLEATRRAHAAGRRLTGEDLQAAAADLRSAG